MKNIPGQSRLLLPFYRTDAQLIQILFQRFDEHHGKMVKYKSPIKKE